MLTLDLALLASVATTARRIFQERWLLENGKVESIDPATIHRRSTLQDVSRAWSQAAYVGGGLLGFGTTFPVVALGRLLTGGDHPVARGARDGARAAAYDADEFLAGLLGRDEPAQLSTAPVHAVIP
jgi:hypothetical protein